MIVARCYSDVTSSNKVHGSRILWISLVFLFFIWSTLIYALLCTNVCFIQNCSKYSSNILSSLLRIFMKQTLSGWKKVKIRNTLCHCELMGEERKIWDFNLNGLYFKFCYSIKQCDHWFPNFQAFIWVFASTERDILSNN